MANKSKNKRKSLSDIKPRNAAAVVARSRNGGFLRHKNERRAKDARNNDFCNNQEW